MRSTTSTTRLLTCHKQLQAAIRSKLDCSPRICSASYMTITIDIEEEESDQAPESGFLDINISKGTNDISKPLMFR